MAGFAKSLAINSKKALWKVNLQCYKLVRELFTLTVQLTPSPSNPGPYADGMLVNQWYPSEGKDFSDELGFDTSSTGAGSLARISSLGGGEFNMKDGAITMANNLSYAYRAEAIGWPAQEGWSGNIGPYRMVARAIQTISARYK